jgi:hypothetical protein
MAKIVYSFILQLQVQLHPISIHGKAGRGGGDPLAGGQVTPLVLGSIIGRTISSARYISSYCLLLFVFFLFLRFLIWFAFNCLEDFSLSQYNDTRALCIFSKNSNRASS